MASPKFPANTARLAEVPLQMVMGSEMIRPVGLTQGGGQFSTVTVT